MLRRRRAARRADSAAGAPFPDVGIGVADFNPRINRVSGGVDLANGFRYAINPPAREQINPVYPDLVLEVAGGTLCCPARPCPQAIDVQDPGMFAVNYRNEPVGAARVRPEQAPSGRPRHRRHAGRRHRGRPRLRAGLAPDGQVRRLARWPAEADPPDDPGAQYDRQDLGFWGGATLNSPTAKGPTDPFTPMIRAYQGDTVRVKIQAGGHEEEHNATILGLKWLQGGSAHGSQKNSGWRNSQAARVSPSSSHCRSRWFNPSAL